MRLFEITASIDAILYDAAVQGGEITDAQCQELDALEMQRERKLLDCACAVKGMEAEEDALAGTIRSLSERKAVIVRNIKRLKDYMLDHMDKQEKLSDGRVRIGWRASTVTKITMLDEVPPEFCKWEKVPVKEDIKMALLSGKQVPGAELEHHNNLQIT